MKAAKILLWILILGSAWGVAEVFGKSLFSDLGLGGATLWLAGWAVLLLAIGRGVWNKVGSSSAIGLLAAFFSFVGPTPNQCHLLGIASLGIFFDLIASILLTEGKVRWWRPALAGVFAVYGARAFFVLYSTYVLQFDRWVEGGAELALQHVLQKGSMAALAALILAPLGFWFGQRVAGMKSPVVDGGEHAQPVELIDS